MPFAPLFIEATASDDAMSYSLEKDPRLLESGYKLLYPAYGTYVGASVLGGVPVVGPAAGAIGAIPGHIIGRLKASEVRNNYPEAFPEDRDDDSSTSTQATPTPTPELPSDSQQK